jgi:hypothetical protein
VVERSADRPGSDGLGGETSLDASADERALADADAGRGEVADDTRPGLERDALGGVQIAADRAAHDDTSAADGGFDPCAFGDFDEPGDLDVAEALPLDTEIALPPDQPTESGTS